MPICKPSGANIDIDIVGVESYAYGATDKFIFNVPPSDLEVGTSEFDVGRKSDLAILTLTTPALIDKLEFEDVTLTAVQFDAQTGDDSITFSYSKLKSSSTPVPVPTTRVLLLTGLGMLGFLLRRKETLRAAVA